jgi:mRNA interferase YafQ
MRQPEYSGQFKRDVKQAQKRGKDIEKLKALLTRLIEGSPRTVFQWKA